MKNISKRLFNIPESFNIFKGQWYWQLFHSVKTMKLGAGEAGHQFYKIQSVINIKCQRRGEGFLFWSLEPSTDLIHQHHYSIYFSCEENIYSGKFLLQGFTAKETVLGKKTCIYYFFQHLRHSNFWLLSFSTQNIQQACQLIS